MYRTDEQGDIVFTSTGHGFETELSPGSYTPGQSSSNSNTSEPSSSTQDSSSGFLLIIKMIIRMGFIIKNPHNQKNPIKTVRY